MTDTELIARILSLEDRAAFGELVLRHQSALRRFLRQLTCGDVALADDLAQDTFLHAYKNLGRFRGEARFSTWLLGIAHNLFRNAHRKRREIPTETPEQEIGASVPSPAFNADLRHDLTAALRKLSPEEQTALHVCYQQDLSHREAATVLGWPEGTVKTHLLRGKEKLRTLLAAWNPQS